MSQSNEKPMTSDLPEDDEDFLRMLSKLEAHVEAVAKGRPGCVDCASGEQSEVHPDLLVTRSFREDLQSGAVNPPKEVVCLASDGSEWKIHIN